MQNQVMWKYQGEMENVDEDLILDYSKLLAVLESADVLADYLNVLFHHGEMTDITRHAIKQIVKGLADDPALAVRSAVYFSFIAPEYIVRP